MPTERKSREEIYRLVNRKLLASRDNAPFVEKTLKGLAPVYGYHPADVVRVRKACGGNGLLRYFKEDAAVGYLVPPSLFIGGISGVRHTDLLCLNITKQRFLKMFMEYAEEYGQATFVFPVQGSNKPWIIHNLEVPPGKRRHCIMLYVTKHGGNHIQLIRMENFIKEFSDEQETEY